MLRWCKSSKTASKDPKRAKIWCNEFGNFIFNLDFLQLFEGNAYFSNHFWIAQDVSFPGVVLFKSIKVSFPQYLPICSEIGSQLETIENKKCLKNLKSYHFPYCNIQKRKIFFCGFSRRLWWAQSILHCLWLNLWKKHLKLQKVYNI